MNALVCFDLEQVMESSVLQDSFMECLKLYALQNNSAFNSDMEDVIRTEVHSLYSDINTSLQNRSVVTQMLTLNDGNYSAITMDTSVTMVQTFLNGVDTSVLEKLVEASLPSEPQQWWQVILISVLIVLNALLAMFLFL